MIGAMPPDKARAAILDGTAPDDLHVDGARSFFTGWGKQPRLMRQPNDLEVETIFLGAQVALRACPGVYAASAWPYAIACSLIFHPISRSAKV